MEKIVTRYRTPGGIDEEEVRGNYYAGIRKLFEEKNFKSVEGFNGLPFWGQPLVCYHESCPDIVAFNPYIPRGFSGPPVSLDVVIISENNTLVNEIKQKFPGLILVPD